MYHGDIALGSTIDIKFTTRSFSTGAPTTLAGSPVISVYPDNSTAEFTTGITLTVDFDARTGLNNVRVAATSGNGYAAATNYVLVITSGTVAGVSVADECVGSFSIENRSGLRPTTAGRTLDVSATGEAGLDWANVGSPTTSLALTGTTIATTQKVDLETIKTNPVVNAGTVTFPTTATLASTTNITAGTITTVSGNVTGSVGSVVATVAANLTQILGTALTETAGQIAAAFKKFFNIATPAATMDHGILVDTVTTLTNAPADSATLTEVGADVDEIITTLGAAGAGLTALGDTRIANLDTTVSSRMATYAQPAGFLAATFPAGTVASTTNITAGTITTATNLTTNNDKTGYGLSAAAVQAIWDALTSALTTVGSIGKWIIDKLDVAVSTRGTGTALDAAGVRSAVGLASANLDTQLSGIQSDTDNIQTRIPAALTGAGNIKADAQVVSDKTGYELTNSGIDAVLDRSNGVEAGFTLRQSLRLMLSALCGKVSGGNTTSIAIRDVNDTVNRIAATVDANGNRTAVTLND